MDVNVGDFQGRPLGGQLWLELDTCGRGLRTVETVQHDLGHENAFQELVIQSQSAGSSPPCSTPRPGFA